MTTENDALLKFAAATNNELYDPTHKGGQWMSKAVRTYETLDHFIESASGWHERTHLIRGEVAGFPFVMWAKIQVRKGDPRREMSVIDLGDVRYALDADLRFYE